MDNAIDISIVRPPVFSCFDVFLLAFRQRRQHEYWVNVRKIYYRSMGDIVETAHSDISFCTVNS